MWAKTNWTVLSILILPLVLSFALVPAETSNFEAIFPCESANSKVANSKVTDLGSYDVVIYGGTPSGAAAAKSAAELGKSVLLLSESSTFGGSISNGLSATDLGSLDANVGLSRDYLDEISRYYQLGDHRAEPKVAECIFRNWLKSERIHLATNVKLQKATLVKKKIHSISFEAAQSPNDITVIGKSFIDASYAGDLMYASGTKTQLGMSDFYDYGENITKFRKFTPQFRVFSSEEILKTTKAFAYLPHVRVIANKDTPEKEIAQGMPSFTYRLCITKDKSNQIPITKDEKYDDYAPAWRIFMNNYFGYQYQDEPVLMYNGTILTQLWRIALIPNNKADLNSYFSSFTNFTMPREYFEDLSSRPKILSQFSGYMKSFLWFVQNDPSVPAFERAALKDYGLCADEFVTNEGWPEQPYLREGRRLVGQTVLTSNDIIFSRLKPDAVAVGSYAMDSKSTSFTLTNGVFSRDKSQLFKVPMYEIPMSTMIPKSGPENLIVSVGISASPSAYASVRMEPQFIQLGQAAGLAAAIASSGSGSISLDLLGEVRSELAKANGFTGVVNICQSMSHSTDLFWEFCVGQFVSKSLRQN